MKQKEKIMKKTIAVAALMFGLHFQAGAQLKGESYELTTSGLWPICALTPTSQNLPFCSGYIPGVETYMLVIKTSPTAAGVRYKVVSRTKSTGELKTTEGISMKISQNNVLVLLVYKTAIAMDTEFVSVDLIAVYDGEVIR